MGGLPLLDKLQVGVVVGASTAISCTLAAATDYIINESTLVEVFYQP